MVAGSTADGAGLGVSFSFRESTRGACVDMAHRGEEDVRLWFMGVRCEVEKCAECSKSSDDVPHMAGWPSSGTESRGGNG